MIPRQRRESSGFPEPIVPVHHVEPATLTPGPYAAGGVYAHAVKHGWVAVAQSTTGYVPDGAWQPAQRTVDVPRQSEDGSPVLTPTGLVSVEKVPTGELIIAETTTVRAAIAWERERVVLSCVWQDGKFLHAWSLRSSRILTHHGIREARALLARAGAPADLAPTGA